MTGKATRATAVLAEHRIEYRLHSYEHRPGHESYGTEAVDSLGLPAERVFKTLVAEADSTLVVGIVPVTCQLDTKALAAAAGVKRAGLADAAASRRATGYVLGGISPLGQRTRMPVFLDSTATGHDTVYCSAGRRGLEIELASADLIHLTDATVAAIARPHR